MDTRSNCSVERLDGAPICLLLAVIRKVEVDCHLDEFAWRNEMRFVLIRVASIDIGC
jgi:hypothetical protein